MELPADHSNLLPPSRPMKFTHAPNDLVLDRYTIRRGIGVGGFGEVYFAVSQAGKEVALKRIQRNLEVELRGVSHCLNLKHQNLVSLHDVCRDSDDQAWVVMEYVAGPNLREVLDDAAKANQAEKRNRFRPSKRLPSGMFESQVRHWFAGVSAGVAHLHSAGLVHRDLKPGNLFDDDGIVKVGDYGLSKFISASHRSGHTESIGTFHYMAPEIGRGQYGREIDLYALGVILFEMLTGELPFDGETPQEIIVKHLTDSPDLSRVPEDYRNVISRCLQKDPKKRPRDVAEMLSLVSMDVQQTPVMAEVVRANSDDRPATDAANDLESNEQAPFAQAALGRQEGGTAMVLNSPDSEEPIARAVRNTFADASAWWRALETSPGIKLVLAISAVAILLVNTHWLLPVLSMVGFFYVPYYVLRHVVLQLSEPPSYSPSNDNRSNHSQQLTSAPATPPKRKPTMSKAQVRALLRGGLADRTRLSRAAEWSTSGMTSMIVAGVLLLLSSVIGMRSTPFTPLALAPYVWMALVIWLGAFGLLGIGKFWESTEGEGLVRRLVSASWGACLGLLAFALGHFLMVPMDEGLTRDIDATALPVSFYLETGVPKAAAMMAHFALLFGVLRMWKPVDPLRRVRLSLWAVTVAVVGEWVVHQIVPVPQPAGMLIAGGVIVMTQLSAPWVKSDAIATV
ncbi:serine/threonine protein kinase [Rhodopirellula sp. JC740]|uniref:Serine/threonine protein kinase n=1 Tax=Rhodopirellula halodulae TaxID=2894198 RepID=A0ABS8NFL9_9BACT|nr:MULTISPECIES: serine/threonine-protein kinase [unclassified Rhodopirellula]MCC9642347.1 serine/threonine protein kinase [Rhodopirellula sp. JC740]MCC9654417.1 serine/threonine protein kinase [Rhodopirellula sp. JC737]